MWIERLEYINWMREEKLHEHDDKTERKEKNKTMIQ